MKSRAKDDESQAIISLNNKKVIESQIEKLKAEEN